MDLGLRGAVVCVAGGSRGIGRAVAELAAAEGARVAVLGRDADALADALADVVARLRSLGAADAVALSCELASPGAVVAAFAALGGFPRTFRRHAAHLAGFPRTVRGTREPRKVRDADTRGEPCRSVARPGRTAGGPEPAWCGVG